LRWLDAHVGHRFFLWVHYFDAHDPYLPEREDTSRERHPGTSWLDRFRSVYGYDSELIGVDRQLGRLVDALRARGDLDRTIVAVVSDHGEGLGDHSYLGHTLRLFQEQLHIPLLIHYPARLPAGLEVEAQVRSIDIAPTLLELLELPVPDDLDGETLLPLLGPTDTRSDRISIAETLVPPMPSAQLFAVSDGRYKLIRSLAGNRRWLYDLRADPREERDLEAEHPDVSRRLAALLDDYLETAATGQTQAPGPELDESQRRRLEALGYLE
jgi:arylsulfatase A-like enzyme